MTTQMLTQAQYVANQLVALCKEGKDAEAMQTLYSQDIISIECMELNGSYESKGIAAVQAKWATWNEMHEIHSVKIEGPFVNQNQFAVKSAYDVTDIQTGQRYTSMEEIAVYDVENGKITKEVFYSLQCK